MKVKSMISLLLLPVIWGCYYVASHRAVEGLSVFSVGVIIRFITMILLTIMMIQKKEIHLLLRTQGVIKRLLLIGLLGFLLDLTAFLGLSFSSAGSGTALLKCDIIFVNLISVIIYKEKFTKKDWMFSGVMLFGVMMVMGVDLRQLQFGGIGNIFFILSALFISINAFIIKSVQLDKKNPMNDNVVAYYNNFVTMLLFLISSFIMGTVGEIRELANDKGSMIAVLCVGVGQTLVYVVYYYNLRRFPVWIVKVALLLMPIVAALVSYVLFGEEMKSYQYIGMLIVLGGAFGVLLEQRNKAQK
ncbi:MAG: DMT family transporter [Lachnospiraceae bacterium]